MNRNTWQGDAGPDRTHCRHPVWTISGCPAPIVSRGDAGGGMLRSLKAMDAALGALRDVLPPGAFTVKCRLGYETPDKFNGFFR